MAKEALTLVEKKKDEVISIIIYVGTEKGIDVYGGGTPYDLIKTLKVGGVKTIQNCMVDGIPTIRN
jgi:hypothetical protein